MFDNQKRWTVANILTVMSVAFAAIGFIQTRYGIPPEFEALKVFCLIVVHACITWSITKILGRVLAEKDRNRPKAVAGGFLAAFYFGVDVWLVHSGLGWIFSGWSELALYTASIGYTGMALVRKWVDTPTPAKEAPKQEAAPAFTPLPPSEETQRILDGIEHAKKRMRLVA